MSRGKPAATILRSRDFISRIVFFGWEISCQMSRGKPAATICVVAILYRALCFSVGRLVAKCRGVNPLLRLRSRDFISRIVFFGWEISCQMSRGKPAATIA